MLSTLKEGTNGKQCMRLFVKFDEFGLSKKEKGKGMNNLTKV